jgi:hypothetical protein
MATAVMPSSGTAVADQVSGGLVRPRFFTGQLLATEDLQQLIDWVAAKDRLHKRLLVGEGVVCGLEVGCHPCGGGRVVVRPGYAIDCCGNDLLLPCEQELDVNAMVRALLAEQRGVDCGDPCAPDTTKTGPGAKDAGEEKPVTRRYALHICHVETLTDPLAPYATDEPCDAEGCEPSRIREGVRFELRCAEPWEEPDDIVARITACLGDLVEIERRAKRAPIVKALDDSVRAAVSEFRVGEATEVGEEDAQTLRQALDGLRPVGGAPPGAPAPDADTVRAALDHLRAAASVAARVNALDDAERAAALKEVKGLDADIKAAPDLLNAVAARLQPALEKALPDGLERSAANALLSRLPAFAGQQLSEEDRKRLETFLAKHGVVVDAELKRMLDEDLAKLREWLLARLRRIRLTTDCGLLAEVEGIDVSGDDSGGDEGEGASRMLDARAKLEQALRRYAAECACGALLPPCPDCDDPCVPLAVIEVRECNVVHVCNLERRMAVTGTALSYWIPMQRLMGLLDTLCCELPREVVAERPAGKQPVREVAVFRRRAEASTAVGEQARMLVEGAGFGTSAAQSAGRVTDNVTAIGRPPAAALVERTTGPLRAQLEQQDKQLASLRMELGKLRKKSNDLDKKLAAAGGKSGGGP